MRAFSGQAPSARAFGRDFRNRLLLDIQRYRIGRRAIHLELQREQAGVFAPISMSDQCRTSASAEPRIGQRAAKKAWKEGVRFAMGSELTIVSVKAETGRMGGLFEPAAGPDQGDPGVLAQLIAVLIHLSQGREELAEPIKDVILLRKRQRSGDPRPGMLVNGVARRQNSRQMLRVHGEKLVRLRKPHARILNDDRQDDLFEPGPMGGNILGAPVARPQNLKYRRIERRDGLVDQRRVLREEEFLLFDDRQVPVEFTRFLKCAARADAQRNVVEQRVFFVLWL